MHGRRVWRRSWPNAGLVFEHTLLTVHGSEYSAKPVELTVGLAEQCEAEVIVAHVHEHDVTRAASNSGRDP